MNLSHARPAKKGDTSVILIAQGVLPQTPTRLSAARIGTRDLEDIRHNRGGTRATESGRNAPV